MIDSFSPDIVQLAKWILEKRLCFLDIYEILSFI